KSSGTGEFSFCSRFTPLVIAGRAYCADTGNTPAKIKPAVTNHLPRMLLYLSLYLRPLIRRRHRVNAAREITSFAARRRNALGRAWSYGQTPDHGVHRLVDRNVNATIGVTSGTIQNFFRIVAHLGEFFPRMHLKQRTGRHDPARSQ